MAIRKGSVCYYVTPQHKVIAATAVTDAGFGGDAVIKSAPEFKEITVRAMDIFSTEPAATRAAATRTSMMGGPSGSRIIK